MAEKSAGVTDAGEEGARLRIICLEEHTLDPAIGESTKAAVAARFPYMQRSKSGYQDDPSASGERRPLLQPHQVAGEQLKQPVAERLAEMDRHGIDVQVLSLSNFTQFADRGAAADLARAANDRLAGIVAEHPDRFGAFATLPWQDPDAAVRELDRVVGDLGLAAAMLSGHPADDALVDDPRYDPLLARLSELGVPLYVHPGPPFGDVQRHYYAGLADEVTARFSLAGWGWHSEAGLQVVRLVLSGAFDRHPGLQVISGHWGEMAPFFLQRMDDMLPPALTGLSRTISQTYREHVYVTPSGLLYTPHHQFVRKVLGPDRLMFAIDYPYLTMTGARAWIEGLDIAEPERAAFAYRTAEQVLRLGPTTGAVRGA